MSKASKLSARARIIRGPYSPEIQVSVKDDEMRAQFNLLHNLISFLRSPVKSEVFQCTWGEFHSEPNGDASIGWQLDMSKYRDHGICMEPGKQFFILLIFYHVLV